jgi:hypothetical protein
LDTFAILGQARLAGNSPTARKPTVRELGALAELLKAAADAIEGLSGGDTDAFFRLPEVQAEWLLAAAARLDKSGATVRREAVREALSEYGSTSQEAWRHQTELQELRLRLHDSARAGLGAGVVGEWDRSAAVSLLSVGGVVRISPKEADSRERAIFLLRDLWHRATKLDPLPLEATRQLELFTGWWDDGSRALRELHAELGAIVGVAMEDTARVVEMDGGVQVTLRLRLEMARCQDRFMVKLATLLTTEQREVLAQNGGGQLFLVGRL